MMYELVLGAICGSFFWILFDANFTGKKSTKIVLGTMIWLISSIILGICVFRG